MPLTASAVSSIVPTRRRSQYAGTVHSILYGRTTGSELMILANNRLTIENKLLVPVTSRKVFQAEFLSNFTEIWRANLAFRLEIF